LSLPSNDESCNHIVASPIAQLFLQRPLYPVSLQLSVFRVTEKNNYENKLQKQMEDFVDPKTTVCTENRGRFQCKSRKCIVLSLPSNDKSCNHIVASPIAQLFLQRPHYLSRYNYPFLE
jgi:hypothetical protein